MFDRISRVAVLLSALFLLAFASRAGAQTYTVTDLGSLDPNYSYSRAVGINNSGQIAGWSNTPCTTTCNSSPYGPSAAFVYQNGAMGSLGTGGDGQGTAANAINDKGQIVGTINIAHGYEGTSTSDASLWTSGAWSDLGVLGGYSNSRSGTANAINNSGVVVGFSWQLDGSGMGWISSAGSLVPLGGLGYTPSAANLYGFTWSNPSGINDSGQVIGLAQNASLQARGFLWSNGTMIDIGTLGGTFTFPSAINNAGQITGTSSLANGVTHPFIYQNGTMTDIGTLGGNGGGGHAINNLGQVVGLACTKNCNTEDVFLYTPGVGSAPGTMIDLQKAIPSNSKWTLEDALGINDAGQIVGYGINPQNQTHAYLLTPAPNGITVAVKQVGNSGTAIQLDWNYGPNSASNFEIHRQPPSGGDTVVDVNPSTACAGTDAASKCEYIDSVPVAFGTYSYRLRPNASTAYSNTATAYQLYTYSEKADLFSKFMPDPDVVSIAYDAAALGFDHFNWLQIITHEPACNPLHMWDNSSGTPQKGAVVVTPHLDPPQGGYWEFGLTGNLCGGDPCYGPDDQLPYYWAENLVPSAPLAWYMNPAINIRQEFQLTNPSAGGDQATSKTAQLWDQPQEPCIKSVGDPAHTADDYMGFVTTLVGVKEGLSVYPSTSTALATFIWNSNYNTKTGGVYRDAVWPPDDSNWTGPEGIFGIQRVDLNSLPLAVRQLMSQNGVGGFSSTAAPASAIPPTTSAFLYGTQGANGWYTSPVQVALMATDVNGPSAIQSTTYSINGDAPTPYTVPFDLTSDGVVTLSYGSVDTSAIAESPRPSMTVSIDQTPPASHMTALPASELVTTFNLGWSGSDATSGIQSYTIYVSDNGGSFSAFLTNVTSTTATFTGQLGHTYGFYSIAQDVAGNTEPAKSAAETSTLINPQIATQTKITTSAATVMVGSSVTFTATVTPATGTSTPTGTVQFNDGAATLGGPVALVNGTATYTTSGLAGGTHTITAAYPGDANFTGSTTSAPVTENIQDFKVQFQPESIVVNSGSSGSVILQLTALGGWNGTIALNCSGLPSGTSCIFAPSQVTGTGSAALTVTTAGLQADATHRPAGPWLQGGAVLAGALLLGIPLRRRRWQIFFCLVLMLGLAALQGCGARSAITHGNGVSPTLPGAYSVTVTANSGSGATALSHSVSVGLVVN